MTPQLEKIARALVKMSGSDPDELIHHPAAKSWDAPTEPRWTQWTETVRIVLSALLPPSEEMVQAMRDNVHEAINADSLSYAFTAAIQSILSEGEGA